MDFNESKSISILGYNLAYYRKGNGNPLIFIHGIITYSFIWKEIAPHFCTTHDVIVIDLLGCGNSDKPSYQDLSLKQHARYIHEFCNKLNLSNITLVCHDVGGGIGQILAANYEKLLSHLVLINSIGYNFWPVQPIISIRTPIIRQLAMAALDYGMFQIVIKRGLFYKKKLTKSLLQEFNKPLKQKDGRMCFLQFAKSLDNANLVDIDDKINLIKIPTLIIRGDADVYLSAIISERLDSQILNSKFVHIETGGHFIQIDEPNLVTDYIKSFLNND